MKTREFLGRIPELVRRRLPEELRDFKVISPFGSLVKLHYGDPAIHYEVWIQRRTGKIEVGLHFEGEAMRNSRYLEALAGRFGSIVPTLGPQIEPEQWTSSWTRLHRLLPLDELEEPSLRLTSELLSNMIHVLEPLVREVKELPPSPGSRRSARDSASRATKG